MAGLLFFSASLAVAQHKASITVDATGDTLFIDGRLWGSNLTNESRTVERTVGNPEFVAAARQMGIRVIRWPGGNNADAYDWKRNERVFPGRRVAWTNSITLPLIAAFVREIGVELSITVNFGTMSPEDAADLVEYCNGPITSEWGQKRAQDGFPEPLNVRFFEVGNEINQPHQWYNSWTAEDPYRYFFGGSEERRGSYQASENVDPAGFKGDFFRVRSDTERVYVLRFPPVRHVQVFSAASEDSARQRRFDTWQQVGDLSAYGPEDRVFLLDSLRGMVTFGDGIHGMAPPEGYFFLVEYTTYGHQGFVDFARAMRAAPSSVPIRIGAVMTPFEQQVPVASGDSLRMALEAMDFWVSHRYDASFPTDTYARRRQMAFARTQYPSIDRLHDVLDSLGIDHTVGIGVTEWNIFLQESMRPLNRTLEAAVIAGEYFIRVLNAQPDLPIWIAHQFALGGTNLALYNNWTSFSIAPMGYVFEGFRPWKGSYRVPVAVDSPGALAYDRVLPFVQAAAARNAAGDTLRLVLTNSAESESIAVHLDIRGFQVSEGTVYRLEGPSPHAHNEQDPLHVTLQSESLGADTLIVQPHSVTFLELTGKSAFTASESWEITPDTPVLQHFPEPFRDRVHIRYHLPVGGDVRLALYDVLGREQAVLVRGWKSPGWHTFLWNGQSLEPYRFPAGVYILRLEAEGRQTMRVMVHIR